MYCKIDNLRYDILGRLAPPFVIGQLVLQKLARTVSQG